MNTHIKTLHSLPTELHSDIVEIVTKIEEPALHFIGDADTPLVRRTALTGYDEAMRRHAYACEAGR